MALSILHVGPGPTFLAPVITDYIFGGIAGLRANLEDVPDVEMKAKLMKSTKVQTSPIYQNRALKHLPKS